MSMLMKASSLSLSLESNTQILTLQFSFAQLFTNFISDSTWMNEGQSMKILIPGSGSKLLRLGNPRELTYVLSDLINAQCSS